MLIQLMSFRSSDKRSALPKRFRNGNMVGCILEHLPRKRARNGSHYIPFTTYLLVINSLMRLVTDSIENGLVRTCMPTSR